MQAGMKCDAAEGEEETLHIHMTWLSGAPAAELDIALEARVHNLKDTIYEVLDIPPLEQRLVLGTTPLTDDEQDQELAELAAVGLQSESEPGPYVLKLGLVHARYSLALSGSWDTSVRVWDLDSGKTLHKLSGHKDSVECTAVDWKARRALSGSQDRTLRLWDIYTGMQLREFRGHKDAVGCVAMDWSSRRGLSGGADSKLLFWDLEHTSPVLKLEGHKASVECLVVDWACLRALSGSHDASLRLWDLSKGVCLRQLLGGGGGAVHCAVANLTSWHAVSAENSSILCWDLQSGELSSQNDGHTGVVHCVKVEWTSQRAVSGGSDGRLFLWNLSSGATRLPRRLLGHDRAICCLDVGWELNKLLSGGEDGSLMFWDISEGCETGPILRMEGHTDQISCVSSDFARSRAVSGGWDGELRVWSLTSGECLMQLLGHSLGVVCAEVDWSWHVAEEER